MHDISVFVAFQIGGIPRNWLLSYVNAHHVPNVAYPPLMGSKGQISAGPVRSLVMTTPSPA